MKEAESMVQAPPHPCPIRRFVEETDSILESGRCSGAGPNSACLQIETPAS